MLSLSKHKADMAKLTTQTNYRMPRSVTHRIASASFGTKGIKKAAKPFYSATIERARTR